MSTRGSLGYWSIGTYSAGTACSVHLYHECLDDTYHVEVEWLSRIISNRTLSQDEAFKLSKAMHPVKVIRRKYLRKA